MANKEDWPPMTKKPPQAPPPPPPPPPRGRHKTLEEQFRCLDDLEPQIQSLDPKDVEGTITGDKISAVYDRFGIPIQPVRAVPRNGYWTGDDPNAWQRFWARLLLGWRWKRFN